MILETPFAQAAIDSLHRKNPVARIEAIKGEVAFSTFEELNQVVGSAPSIISAGNYYARTFGLTPPEKEEFIAECLGQRDETPVTGMVRKCFEKLEPEWQEKYAVTHAIEASYFVHDDWRFDEKNAARFFGDKVEKEAQYQYVPGMLIGSEEMAKDLRYVLHTQGWIGYNSSEQAIKEEFQIGAAEYIINGIQNYGGLAEYVSSITASNPHLDPAIRDQFRDIDWVKETILPQLMEKGFGKDEITMKMIEQAGIDITDHLPQSLDVEIAHDH